MALLSSQEYVLIAEAMGRHPFDTVSTLHREGEGGDWDSPFQDTDIAQKTTDILQTKFIPRLQEDVAIWKATSDGPFSLRTAWEAIRQSGIKVAWHNLIWFPNAQPQFSFIAWLAPRQRLPTLTRLAIWRDIQDTTCCL
ncbi:uncharacterized protein LOC122665676 [Telopea speciosissima]|uniref:uncharacterized protein LOC122665676 n=1 Tax=Telopea speciosissima TaxID=54955 RepID=UPI001CC5853E|nr:uncharacterized protein LOC122665676 [Telopea speciosissima]